MNNNTDNVSRREPAAGALGTFGGVFTPSVLTILGIILFSRLGFVVGSGGLGRALVILLIANAISVLTSLSLSAISTNIRVKVGGVYYLISRTLGLEFGGAIGIVMFLAQAVSIAFYCIGFGEVLAAIVAVENIKTFSQIVALLSVAVLFVFAWMGADWATRFQYVVMAFLGAALVSFFIGGITSWNPELFINNWAAPQNGLPFWTLFAIFFPAVTGFTQGSSMSGDLKDPGKSLPLGTLLAVAISILIYFGSSVLLAGSVPGSILTSDYAAMKQVSLVRFLIDVGVISATLSSAMASFLGAPRILQSLAADRIFPFLHPFAKGSGPANNPRKAVLLCLGIALATIGLGQLNIIAPVVSMFFLVSYGLLNYATYYEAKAASPSFRPRFRWFHARLSLLGALACLGTMMTIDLTAGVVAASVLFAIYHYLKHTSGPARWADSQRAYHLQQVREHLLSAADEPEHPRNWRPHVLLFSEDANRRKPLLDFAAWVQGRSGFTTVVRILEGEGVQMLRQKEEAHSDLQKNIREHGISAFSLVLAAPDLTAGIYSLVQAFGIGPLRANTILLNWLEHVTPFSAEASKEPYGRNLRTVFRLRRNIVILDAKPETWSSLGTIPAEQRRIDVWWRGDATGELMLLLAYLMTRSDEWANAAIRVLAACVKQESEQTVEGLRKMLDDVRIEAQPEAVIEPTAETVAACSKDASLVFLPFRLIGNQPRDPFGGSLEVLLPRLPPVALVLAAEDIALDAEPEDGKVAEVAAAMDGLEEARKKAHKKDAVADKAKQQAEQKQQQAAEAAQTDTDPEKLKQLRQEADEAQKAAQQASRKAAKAAAKVKDAAQNAAAAGVQVPEDEK